LKFQGSYKTFVFMNGVGNHWAHSLFYCFYNIYLHNPQHLFKLK